MWYADLKIYLISKFAITKNIVKGAIGIKNTVLLKPTASKVSFYYTPSLMLLNNLIFIKAFSNTNIYITESTLNNVLFL